MEELPPDRVNELVSSGQAQLVDVRTDEEWEAGRIPDARHIPLDRLAQTAETLERDRPVVFYCHVGERSRAAAEAFAASDWEAISLAGGIAAWADQGLPVEPQDGAVERPTGLPPR